MKIENFKFHENGLKRFFGPLEARIMEFLWNKSGEAAIKEVVRTLERDQDKPLSFNTVMTVMNRLVDKGILQRRIESRSSLYRPVMTRDEFMDRQSRELSRDLVEEFGPLAVHHMVDALEKADPELLKTLEQKLMDKKKEPS